MKIEIFPVQTIQENGALCLLLIIEYKQTRFQIMLDCGLNQKLESNHIKHYMNKIQKSKLVLLSQPALEYSAAIPMISEFNIKTLATSPIIDFAMRNFIDQYTHLQQPFLKKDVSEEDFKQEWKRILESVEDSYKIIKPLKFDQIETTIYENGLFHVQVCPIRAGKVIGGCAWKLQINTLNIIYITEYNMVKELHIESLNVERLFVKNQRQSTLHREQVDLLILENYPKEQQLPQIINQPQNYNYYIKTIMEEQLHNYVKKLQGQLIFTFYPNERVLEGIKSLHQIFKENEKYVGMKWDIYVNYFDLVDKARQFSEFLCWDNIQSLNQDSQMKIKPQIILMSYNNLFSGPFYQESLLTDPLNTIVIFDKPPQLLNDNMSRIKKNIELNFNIKESYSLYLNQIRKLLLKQSEKEIKQIQSIPASTTLIAGSVTDLQESISIEQSNFKGEDDQFSMFSEQIQVEPLFDTSNYKSHLQLYQTDPESKETIMFANQNSEKPLRPLQQLHIRDEYGGDIPKYIKQLKLKRQQQIENQAQLIEEEQDAEIEKQKLQESNFILPKFQQQSQKSIVIQATIVSKNIPLHLKNAQMLLEYLNPQQILILNSSSKPRQCEQQILIGKQNQALSIVQINDGLNLPFVEMKQNEVRASIQVKGHLEIKISQYTQTMSNILKLTPFIQRKKDASNTQIQLLALYEELKKRNDIKIEVGFCQISLNDGQIIITKNQQGFKLEGYFCNLYKEIRNLIKMLNI